MPKIKDKESLRAVREKHRFKYRGNPMRSSADFSAKTLKWQEIFKVMD